MNKAPDQYRCVPMADPGEKLVPISFEVEVVN